MGWEKEDYLWENYYRRCTVLHIPNKLLIISFDLPTYNYFCLSLYLSIPLYFLFTGQILSFICFLLVTPSFWVRYSEEYGLVFSRKEIGFLSFSTRYLVENDLLFLTHIRTVFKHIGNIYNVANLPIRNIDPIFRQGRGFGWTNSWYWHWSSVHWDVPLQMDIFTML